ncbi:MULTISPECIES: hypothetical protein [unclassified Variovorax]|nr:MULTISPECIES: hypothetical protein [unclassified Variovorax]VTU43045.1 hypothetical protein H6P1_00343 [Variovorax sp. PBL-H6]VTU43493.1 hypothetical protein SRS16P1_00562 [Variovorax sp. SRS16]VTU43552.1 hypothetical protein E5P1_00556 [Variovorax sp. PBL-E5]
MRPIVLPVIHFAEKARAFHNAAVAFDAGCDGVWLISMDGRDSLLEPAALEIKAAWPTKQVGINYLTLPAVEAIRRNVAAGLDMT